MPMRGKLQLALLGAALVLLACAPAAGASHGQRTFFESPKLLLTTSTRPATLKKLEALGVKALRVELSWRTVAPRANSVHRPSFSETSPAAYNWSEYDPLIEAARSRGWQVLLTVTSPVPRWA